MTETTTGPNPSADLPELAMGLGTTTDSPFLPAMFTKIGSGRGFRNDDHVTLYEIVARSEGIDHGNEDA